MENRLSEEINRTFSREPAISEPEYEQSFVIGRQEYEVALVSYLREAVRTGNLEISEITDYYVDRNTRIRLQDGNLYLTKKTTDKDDPNKIIEKSIEITRSIEFNKQFPRALLEQIFGGIIVKRHGILKTSIILIKFLAVNALGLFENRALEKKYLPLVEGPNNLKNTKKLVKKRLIIRLEDATLHIDVYEGRMEGMVKLDVEIDNTLDEDERKVVFTKYRKLFKGYYLSEIERRVYENDENIKDLLPYQMMFTELEFGKMSQFAEISEEVNFQPTYKEVGTRKEIKKETHSEFIKKVLRLLNNQHIRKKIDDKRRQYLQNNPPPDNSFI